MTALELQIVMEAARQPVKAVENLVVAVALKTGFSIDRATIAEAINRLIERGNLAWRNTWLTSSGKFESDFILVR